MESILPILIKTVLGGGGGFLGSLIKKNGLGLLGNLLSGAVGGNVLPLITAALGLFQNSADGGGGMPSLATILTSLIGGGAGSLIGGLFKKAS